MSCYYELCPIYHNTITVGLQTILILGHVYWLNTTMDPEFHCMHVYLIL